MAHKIFLFISYLGLCLLIFFSMIDADSDDQSSNHRTAVCITGRHRVVHASWKSPDEMITNDPHFPKQFIGNEGGPTTNIINNIFEPLSKTGFDVFMIVNHVESSIVKEHLTGSTNESACSAFRESHVFDHSMPSNNGEGNNFFCLIEREEKLADAFIKRNPIWQSFVMKTLPHAIEGHLQQAYSVQRCNAAIKNYEAAVGINYKYKMRLRSDMVWLKPIPDVRRLNFSDVSDPVKCMRQLFVTTRSTFPGGNEDTYAFGLSEDMDVRMNHYDYLTIYSSKIISNLGQHWTNEISVIQMLKLYNLCLKFDESFQAVVIRPQGFLPLVYQNFQDKNEIKQALTMHGGGDWKNLTLLFDYELKTLEWYN